MSVRIAPYEHPITLADQEVTDVPAQPIRDTVVFIGAGQNTAHMDESIERLGQLHPVEVFEVTQPQIPIEPERFHLTNTPEGRESSQQLLESGRVHAAYISTVPSLHVPMIEELLPYVGRGLVDFLVVAKPVVQNVEEMRRVDTALRAATLSLRQQQGSADGELDPLLYVHEHYKMKGAWYKLRKQLGTVTTELGRLVNLNVSIEESQTVEQEDRLDAFAGGAWEDLGPHVISLGLDIQSSINRTGLYSIPNRSSVSMKRYRYKDSALPNDQTETGFVVRGETEIIDNRTKVANGLKFVWTGGKGLTDSKLATLTFVHPETEAESVIVADLRRNTLIVPEAVKDLFIRQRFHDNGYGYAVEVGLNGGDPRRSFQPWSEARAVTKWQDYISRQGSPMPELIDRGASLHHLAETE